MRRTFPAWFITCQFLSAYPTGSGLEICAVSGCKIFSRALDGHELRTESCKCCGSAAIGAAVDCGVGGGVGGVVGCGVELDVGAGLGVGVGVGPCVKPAMFAWPRVGVVSCHAPVPSGIRAQLRPCWVRE